MSDSQISELTSVFVNEKCLGRGTLYISEARVSWVGEQEQGFSLEYPHVAMHAVQRDLSVFPKANLYLIIGEASRKPKKSKIKIAFSDVRLVDSDGTPTPSSSRGGSDEESDDGLEEDDKGMTEIRFVPEDDTKLQDMFNAMSACQALHPDPADISEEEEEAEEGGEEGEEEEGMFDDAEEDPSDPAEPSNGNGNAEEEPMDQ